MKNIVIFGANDFGRLLKFYMEEDSDERKVVAFTMNEKFIKDREYLGLPVVPFEQINKAYPPEENEILIAIGYSKMNEIRREIFDDCKEKGYTVASFVHSTCTIHSDSFGEGNILLEKCMIYPFVTIGKGNLLWDHVVISHDCSVGDFNTFSGNADLCGYVKIGNNCFLGKHCVVQERSVLADYTLVGAMAFSKGCTKPYEVVVPARSAILDYKRSIDLM